MTHIPGHVPEGTLVIADPTIGKKYHVHGYLMLAQLQNNKYQPTDFRILFLDNHQLLMTGGKIKPEYDEIPKGSFEKMSDQQKMDRMVGFHLKLIEMPGSNKNWAVAYDLVKWREHEFTESCLQGINGFQGKRVEDIDPPVLRSLAARLEDVNNKDNDVKHMRSELGKHMPGTKKKVDSKNVISILKQSANYIESDSYQKSKAGISQYDWITKNITDFKQLSMLFGLYKEEDL